VYDVARFAGRSVTVVVPDATRPLDPIHVEFLVRDLEAVRARTTILVALGLHRPMTEVELAPLSRIATAHGAQIVQHDAADPGAVAEVGEARFHRSIAGAGAVIAVGLVEPHQYAGFSGGVKTVSIGCADRETIGRLHGLRLLREPGTRLGRIDGNPFRAELERLAVPLLDRFYALQIVPGGGVYFGPVLEVFRRAVAEAERLCFDPIDAPLEWMHLEVPAAKAQSFYQASRAATYVALAERPAIRHGGRLILDAPCPEGLGAGSGERAFAKALERGRERLLEELRTDDKAIAGGEQRAYVLALALERAEIVTVGAAPMPELAAFGIPSCASVEEAVGDRTNGRRFADPFHKVPILGAHIAPA
jgi:nickel-dependent lactate racemase